MSQRYPAIWCRYSNINIKSTSFLQTTSGYQCKAWFFLCCFSPRNSLPQASKNDDFRAGALPQPVPHFGPTWTALLVGTKIGDSHKGGFQEGVVLRKTPPKMNQTTIATCSFFFETWEWLVHLNCNSSKIHDLHDLCQQKIFSHELLTVWHFSFFPPHEKQVPFEKYISLKSHPLLFADTFPKPPGCCQVAIQKQNYSFHSPGIGDWILGQPNKSSQIRPHEPKQNLDSLVSLAKQKRLISPQKRSRRNH